MGLRRKCWDQDCIRGWKWWDVTVMMIVLCLGHSSCWWWWTGCGSWCCGEVWGATHSVKLPMLDLFR